MADRARLTIVRKRQYNLKFRITKRVRDEIDLTLGTHQLKLKQSGNGQVPLLAIGNEYLGELVFPCS